MPHGGTVLSYVFTGLGSYIRFLLWSTGSPGGPWRSSYSGPSTVAGPLERPSRTPRRSSMGRGGAGADVGVEPGAQRAGGDEEVDDPLLGLGRAHPGGHVPLAP